MTMALAERKKRINDLKALLARAKGDIAQALPRHMTPERMARMAVTAALNTPKLLECTQASIIGCVLQMSQLGLEPGVLGRAYLVPYKSTCTLIIGYRGLLELATRSGQISTICARVVHANDTFDFAFGLEDTLTHVPEQTGNPGPMTAVYAKAKLKDGAYQYEVMWKHEVDAIRKRSMASNSGPWVTDYDEMAKKTVLRRLCKMLPASVELSTAVALDERSDAGLSQGLEAFVGDPEIVEERPPETKLGNVTKKIAAKMKKSKQRPEEPVAETVDRDTIYASIKKAQLFGEPSYVRARKEQFELESFSDDQLDKLSVDRLKTLCSMLETSVKVRAAQAEAEA